MKIILAAVVQHIHPLPTIRQDLFLGPRADLEAPSRRRAADLPRVVTRSEAGRHQPRHRPDPLDSADLAPSRLLDGVPYAISSRPSRPTGTAAPASAAFLAQQFAQAGDADDGDEPAGLSAEAAAAYRTTAERGATLLGPELHVSYRL